MQEFSENDRNGETGELVRNWLRQIFFTYLVYSGILTIMNKSTKQREKYREKKVSK